MLNPFRYGFFSFQLLSHKVLRYLVPELLLGTFCLSLALCRSDSPGPACTAGCSPASLPCISRHSSAGSRSGCRSARRSCTSRSTS